jgi:hypothetical protein
MVFLGYALFELAPRLSGLALAFGWTLAVALAAFRLTRARQMVVQYGFIRTPEA